MKKAWLITRYVLFIPIFIAANQGLLYLYMRFVDLVLDRIPHIIGHFFIWVAAILVVPLTTPFVLVSPKVKTGVVGCIIVFIPLAIWGLYREYSITWRYLYYLLWCMAIIYSFVYLLNNEKEIDSI